MLSCGGVFAEDAPPTPAPAPAPAPVPAPAPAAPAAAAKLLLKKGGHVAIVGDSITEQKLYSKFMEAYLTLCVPQYELKVMQFGWSGERAPGFQNRMNNDLMPFEPTVVTTVYGMNDGNYTAFNDNTGNTYKAAMTEIVSRLKKAEAVVVIGSPGAVDTKYYHNSPEQAKVYNETLGKLRDIDKALAESTGMPFADLHETMVNVMAKAKTEFGDAYDVCGQDGVHPRPNGHVIMAYSLLKGMGLDGEIGTITVDLKGQTTASEGHTVVKSEGGKVDLQSSRYPYCFSGGDPKSPASPRSILGLLPFNDELNRFTLIVKNVDADEMSVTWGAEFKNFSKADLEKGINLAAAFPDNPFSAPFAKIEGMIAAKQNFETDMIKNNITRFGSLANTFPGDAEVTAAVDVLKKKFYAKEEKLQSDVRAAVVPVAHTIVIGPAKEGGAKAPAKPQDAPAPAPAPEKK